MTNKTPPIWIFFAFMLLGFWLWVAPTSFPYQRIEILVSDFISGLLLIILGWRGRTHCTPFLLWVIAFIGIWLQMTPLLFWAKESAAYLNNTVVGSMVTIFAVILFPMPNQIPDEEPTIPPGWTYNPSSWPQRIPVALFAFFCWMISRYLAAYQLGYIDTVWDPFFTPGTKDVLESSVSHAFPVSDAGLGAFAYTMEFLATCQGGKARWRTSPWGVIVFGILVIPVSLVSTILIILQPLVVGTWCSLCLLTAACMIITIPLAMDEVLASLQYLRYRGKKPLLALIFQGGNCPDAKEDKRTPLLNDSFKNIGKASLWGVSFPWNLCITPLLGILLMSAPSWMSIRGTLFDLDPILGAFVVIVSVLSWAECTRKIRWLNVGFAFILLFSGIITGEKPLFHILLALFIGLLSLRKGPIYESHTYAAKKS